MATYKGIKGFTLQNVSSDPTVNEGQLWYNSASSIFKLAATTATGSWASGGALNAAKGNIVGAGTQTAGLGFAGYGGSPTSSNTTEEYNGSAWSTANNMNTGSYGGTGAGIQTAALAFMGVGRGTQTEEYDGTNWSIGGAIGTARNGPGGAGLQTAGLAVGGGPSPFTRVEEYNGSSWTAVTAYPLNNSGGPRVVGLQTAALAFSGEEPPGSKSVASRDYDGTNWTTAGNRSTAVGLTGGFGVQTLALAVGGQSAGSPNAVNSSELYDGTSWSTETNYPAGLWNLAGAGTASAGMAWGGQPPSPGTTSNYEWTGAGADVTKTITTS
tara:strand:+ start:25 stop:1002 length:978 start_codon:yes stop_codon:yes gene_type:complete